MRCLSRSARFDLSIAIISELQTAEILNYPENDKDALSE
jgi:hypothetical protein